MKYSVCIRRSLHTLTKMLMRPNDWLCNIYNKKTLSCTISASVLFMTVGIALERQWSFPHFYKFVFGFIFIGALDLWALACFSKKISSIVAAVANQPAAKKANYIFHRYCLQSPLYILAPLAVVFIFGIGGCSMFGAMAFNLTLIWVLILFFFVVYISIIGYLQYIVLAVYIRNLASDSGKFRKLPKSMIECVPAQLEWLQNLTKLSHTYRSCFFTLGSSYIIAFGAFCWLPEMQANTSTPAFFLLWGIIFVVIVLLFPIVSVLEYCWIKQIVEHLKASYIEDLEAESKLTQKSSAHVLSPATERLAQTLCAIQIMNSRDYPLKSAWAACYAAVLSVFNFGAAAATIMQVTPTLSSVLQQIS